MKQTKEDSIFSLYIRTRDGWRCKRCGKFFPEGERRGFHCSHYMGRTNQATRFDEENCDGLCYGCHSYFEDRKQTAYRDWKIKQLGEKKVKALEFRSRQTKKWKPKEKEELINNYKIKTANL